jgi:hypothetical protein
MVINLMEVISLNDEQFAAEVAKRRQTLNLKDGDTVIGCPTCTQAPAAPARTDGQQQ